MKLLVSIPLFCIGAFVQSPGDPGKEVTARVCSQCHEIERALSLRQDRDGWQATVDKMSVLGMQAKPEDIAAVVDYLARTYPGQAVQKLNVNTASPIELESALSLRRSESAALIAYRDKHGKFKSLDDLKNVPGVNFAKFEANKDRLTF